MINEKLEKEISELEAIVESLGGYSATARIVSNLIDSHVAPETISRIIKEKRDSNYMRLLLLSLKSIK